ncbi:hypothetical protein WAK64_08230 [Bacillus spongiae]|uniref:Uncharacterized protein n=1 Tax=Bacillus spongiae TaxID=2683610 RepID=A0ABU8HCQ6_9BACI
MGDEQSKSCHSVTGAGISIGFFSLGLFIVMATSLVLVALFWSITAIIVLIFSGFFVLVALFMIWKLVFECGLKRRNKKS